QCFKKKNGDGISALRWLTNWDFPETIQRVCAFLRRDIPYVDGVSVSGRGGGISSISDADEKSAKDPASQLTFLRPATPDNFLEQWLCPSPDSNMQQMCSYRPGITAEAI